MAQAPNDEWAIDFKGWVRTGDGRRCDPLTLSDTVTRYLLEARIGPISTAWVKPILERAFRDYGLPRAIRSDNGPPFGSDGAGGLTRLSVWWLKLGIAPHFIPPSAPQNNGRLERLHRTIGEQATGERAANPAELQARIDAFRRHYNEERPHEALDQDQPAVRWEPSSRSMPDRLEDPAYGPDYDVRRVRQNGYIKWKGDGVFIGQALTGELIGIVERDDKHHIVQFRDLAIGAINREGKFLRFAPIRHGLRKAQEPPEASKVSTINPVQSVEDHSG